MTDDRIDLRRERDLGAILQDAFGTFWRHMPVFLTLALVVVAPVVLLVDGVWGGQLADPGAGAPLEAVLVSTFVNAFVVTALVTALHVRVVQALAEGHVLGVRQAFAAARPSVPDALGAVALAALAALGGVLLAVLGAIWIGVRLVFAAQSAVVDARSPRDALRESWRMTKDRWWRTFGILLVVQLLVGLLVSLPTAILAGTGSGPLYVSGVAVFQAVGLSIVAIAATLLFFDTRLRVDGSIEPRPASSAG